MSGDLELSPIQLIIGASVPPGLGNVYTNFDIILQLFVFSLRVRTGQTDGWTDGQMNERARPIMWPNVFCH